jgi:hypothetical protein
MSNENPWAKLEEHPLFKKQEEKQPKKDTK